MNKNKIIACWLDENGVLRGIGPFTPKDRAVGIKWYDGLTTQGVIKAVEEIYKEKELSLNYE